MAFPRKPPIQNHFAYSWSVRRGFGRWDLMTTQKFIFLVMSKKKKRLKMSKKNKNPGHLQEMCSIVRKPFSSKGASKYQCCFTAFSCYIWPLVNTASYPCLTRPLVNNLLCSFKSIPDMEIRCKSAKDVLVGLYFLLAMERMFTLGKNLTQKLDPCFTKGCFLSLGITAWISDD